MTDGHHRSYVEILATVLLSLAAVATAWSGYQATRWNGEQAKAAGRTNAIRVEAARAQGLSESQTQVDVATFIQWVDAYALKRTELSDFYFKRFRKEFRPAVQAWLDTRPLVNPDAPLTPFAMPQYKLAAAAEARRLDAAAEVSAAEVRRDIQRGSNYVLGVVLFSVSLFFAGLSPRLTDVRLRTITLALGCFVFLGTLIWIATSPVSISVLGRACRDRAADTGAVAGRRMNLDRPARDRKSIAHADEAAALRRGTRVETRPVVPDLEAHVARVLPDLDGDARVRGTVLGGILEGFERREVDGRLDLLAVPLEPADLHPDAAIRPSRLRQRGSEPEVAEDGRVGAVGDRPDLVQRLLEPQTHLLELLVPAQTLAGAIEVDPERDQLLLRAVVQVALDPAPFGGARGRDPAA